MEKKLRISKNLNYKYENGAKTLVCKAGFRKIDIFILCIEDEKLYKNALDILATRCIDEKIYVEKIVDGCGYLVPEHHIKEFNVVYREWKKELIQNRKNYLKLREGKNRCACSDKHMCIFVNCGCSCHDEEKLLNPGVWKYAGTIRMKVIAYISAYGANSDYVKNLMNENFDSLDNSDIEYICQNACENSDNCVWCPLYSHICKQSENNTIEANLRRMSNRWFDITTGDIKKAIKECFPEPLVVCIESTIGKDFDFVECDEHYCYMEDSDTFYFDTKIDYEENAVKIENITRGEV